MREGFRSAAEKLGGIVKKKAAKAINEGSSVASSVFKEGKKTAMKTAQTASKEVSGKVEQAYQKGKSVALDQVSSASKRASSSVRNASSTIATKTSETINETIAEGKKLAPQAATSAINWFWWWSLAAIGVYGIATTIPKELIRYALSGGHGDLNNKRKQEEESKEETKKSSWLALDKSS
jgi:hypothetical protein